MIRAKNTSFSPQPSQEPPIHQSKRIESAGAGNSNTTVLSLQQSSLKTLKNIVDFGIFKWLRVLYLYDNNLTVFPEHLGGVAHSLEELYIQGNDIGTLSIEYPLPRLTILDAMRCRISLVTFKMDCLPALQKLSLAYQKDGTFGDDGMSWDCDMDSLPALSQLDISGNPIASLNPILATCPRLTMLTAKSCRLGVSLESSSNGWLWLPGTPHDCLQTLNLSGNSVVKGKRDYRKRVLAAFPALQELDGRTISDLERMYRSSNSGNNNGGGARNNSYNGKKANPPGSGSSTLNSTDFLETFLTLQPRNHDK